VEVENLDFASFSFGFLAHDLDISSLGLENASTAPRPKGAVL